MAEIHFEALWQNYPHAQALGETCSGSSATRLARALSRCGITTPYDRRNLSEGAADSVRAMAEWLSPGRFPGCPMPQSLSGPDVPARLSGRRGIVLLESQWQPPGAQALRPERHLDLWNREQMTIGAGWLRTHLGVNWEGRWPEQRGLWRLVLWELA